ncbi:FtsX-like permease family protein [Streptomyces sp. B1866]|uniref:ABC transporter permease n=1 Tax=Streptomyces sp. B1866 TaxID=3075431 RepID=UPI002892405E|nr:FtsX-like permease family protein [Streptomyces sp. B1866]MDT3399674.1 FtsX-like permease family protein [Streptomyces sp. B1866]
MSPTDATDHATGHATARGTAPGPAAGGGREGTVHRWAADLAMGARFSVTGGRESWTRTVLTAVGVALGVALLLVAASIPHAMSAREARDIARSLSTAELRPGPATMEVQPVDTAFHGRGIHGIRLSPDGDRPPPPPGLSRVPGPGELAVSPALKRLLLSPGAKLLRERIGDRVTATIGKAGLANPRELRFYAGVPRGALYAPGDAEGAYNRIDHWGYEGSPQPLDPGLTLLVVVGCVVLLLPVGIFVATAARFGGERRDRRLAALRLVGADRHMTRRIAAGEALSGSLIGLALGAGVFLLLRQWAGSASLWGLSMFTSDIQPSGALVLMIAVGVPAVAVGVTLVALRRVTIEPLGVVRGAATRRRRVWWRLLLPAAGLALLLPKTRGDGFVGDSGQETAQITAGIVLVLVGTTALLPWVVEAVVLRARGGPVPWQLAVRRLQLSSAAAARAVSGISVAIAGAIALTMLFQAVEDQNTKETGADPSRAQLETYLPASGLADLGEVLEPFRGTRGVRRAVGYTDSLLLPAGKRIADGNSGRIFVGDCAALRELARIDRCQDGDVFTVPPQHEWDGDFMKPGATVNVSHMDDEIKAWTIPATAPVVGPRPDPAGFEQSGVMATPSAVKEVSGYLADGARVLLSLDPRVPDAEEYARNTDARLSLSMSARRIDDYSESDDFAKIRAALLAGATATLLLIGASMIVSTLEQLRERRRLLSVLVAFGTRRATLSWSVLWQTAVPVVLGLGLSVAGGLALGAVLSPMVDRPVAVDWASVGTMAGVGAGVIALVTLVSLPPLWRMMRPDGLRTE